MANCAQCGADTQLHDGGVPVCLACISALQPQETDPKPKPPRSERTLGSVNTRLTAAREDYRRAMAIQIECARLVGDAGASNPGGSHALRNANEQLAIAAAKYEDALREFIAFTDPRRRAV